MDWTSLGVSSLINLHGNISPGTMRSSIAAETPTLPTSASDSSDLSSELKDSLIYFCESKFR
jgi:hypothetical protein